MNANQNIDRSFTMIVTDFTKMLPLDDLEVGMEVSFNQLGNIYDIPIYLRDFQV